MPKKPDYIIAENGNITKEALRHAKYFGIPIINVERKVYEEKAKKRGEELLASISEGDGYKEIDKKVAELLSMSEYKSAYRRLEGIGRSSDIPRPVNPTPLEEKCLKVSQMELLKRLDFLKNTIEEATHRIESATEEGLPMDQKIPGLDRFDIDIYDVQNQLHRMEDKDKKDSF
jgi:hypothetical protein